MKNLFRALVITLIFCFSQPAFGSFPVKHIAVLSSSGTKPDEPANIPAPGYTPDKPNWLSANQSHLLNTDDGDHKPPHKKVGTGQLLSFIFGILSLGIVTGIFSIPAIILGAIGIHNRKKFSRTGLIFSTIGMSIGIAVVVLFVLLALFFD